MTKKKKKKKILFFGNLLFYIAKWGGGISTVAIKLNKNQDKPFECFWSGAPCPNCY